MRISDQRPDWVHCIGHTHVDLAGQSWCEKQWEMRPFFQDSSHASENARKGGRLVACRECVAAIMEALKNGHDDPEYP